MHLSATQATSHLSMKSETAAGDNLPDFQQRGSVYLTVNKLEHDMTKNKAILYSILLCVVYMQQFIVSSFFCVFYRIEARDYVVLDKGGILLSVIKRSWKDL